MYDGKDKFYLVVGRYYIIKEVIMVVLNWDKILLK